MRPLILLALVAVATAQLTETEKTSLLALHNTAKTATQGASQYRYVWDATIAATAQKYADACPGKHSSTGTSFRAQGNGENLAWGWPSRTVTSTMDGWVKNELVYYTYSTNGCSAPAGKSCGHYTQVVWDTSHKLGCGKKRCNSFVIDGQTKPSGDVYVCQYGPGGNSGRKPYSAGTACTACIGSCGNGLCTKPTTCSSGLFQVSGSSKQPNANGFYKSILPTKTLNGKPVYTGAATGFYIYFAGNRWFLDNDLNNNGYIGYVYSTAATPPASGWQVWPGTGSFAADGLKFAACGNTAAVEIPYDDSVPADTPGEPDEALNGNPETYEAPADPPSAPDMSSAAIAVPMFAVMFSCLAAYF